MNKQELLIALQFNLTLIAATESLLYAAGMRDRIQEEKDHAQWLARDIQGLGGRIDLYDYDAAAIAGAQYYHILHADPKMLLGYMAALECNIMSPGQVAELETQHGPLPCLKYHAIHDQEHGAWVLREIEQITDERLYGLVIGNRRWTEAAIITVLQSRLMAHKEHTHGECVQQSESASAHVS